MTTKLLFMSDLHLFKWREFSRTPNERLLDCYTVFGSVKDIAERENVDAIVIAGDVFHKKSILDTETFNLGMAGVAALKPFHVYMTPGNHDQATKDGSVHSLEAFQYLDDHVLVASVPTTVHVGSVKVLLVPYTHKENLTHAVKHFTHDLAVVHAGFSGATVGSYEYKPPEELEVADLGKLPKGRVSVVSGHYHNPQALANGKIVYVGAPLEHTRSDLGSPKRGLMLWEDGRIKRIPLNLPRFVRLTDKDVEDKDPSEWDIENNFVDIVLTEEPQGGIEKFRTLCDQLPARGVNVVFTPPASLPEKRLDVDPSLSLTTMIERYLDEYAPDHLDRKKLDALVKEVL